MISESSIEKREFLWKEYSKTGDINIRDKLITEYAYLIKFIAGRLSIYFGSNVEYEELMSYGVFGLIDAVDKFDLSKGVKFETYASLRIRGSIIDSIRAADWVPRSVRQKHKELEKAYNDLENILGRPATDDEIADKIGINSNELHKRISDINVTNTVSLEEYIEQKFQGSFDIPSDNSYGKPEKQTELSVLRDVLTNALDNLPEKEKMVLSLYYYDELTLKEISAVMGVSESRISQLHTKALLRLKGRIGKHKDFLLTEWYMLLYEND